MLYDAITGSSSRLVITSLSPELPAAQEMTFGEYLQRMEEKFMPAAEGLAGTTGLASGATTGP